MSLSWIRDYEGQPLAGATVTAKIDGVCGITDGAGWTSRNGKPLYNLPAGMEPGEYEVFAGSWADSMTACRTHNGTAVPVEQVYRLRPADPRLVLATGQNITRATALVWLQRAVALGYEGIVFHCDGIGYRLKPVVTYDVPVLAIQPGTGKHSGRMGALMTTMGKVGTGFCNEEREQFTADFIVGKTIEVDCMGLTPGGQFRHPRFVRVREDK